MFLDMLQLTYQKATPAKESQVYQQRHQVAKSRHSYWPIGELPFLWRGFTTLSLIHI